MFKNQRRERWGGVTHIGALFEKYKTRLRPPQGSVVKAFCEKEQQETSIVLAKENVRYNPHSRTISLTTRGPEKTEILLAQKSILGGLKKTLGEHSAPTGVV